MRNKPKAKLQILLATLLILSLVHPAGPVLASTRVSVGISGGPLGFTIAGAGQLNDATLTGYDQTAVGALGLVDVRDARGTGQGWNLVIDADDFVDTGGSGGTIPAAGFSVDEQPQVTKVAGNTEPLAFSGTLDQPLTLLSAAPNTGMGRFQVSPDLALVIPAATIAGSYESTVTLTIASGF